MQKQIEIDKALQLGKHATSQETINAALTNYIKRWKVIFDSADKKCHKNLTEADVEREIAAVRAKRRGKE